MLSLLESLSRRKRARLLKGQKSIGESYSPFLTRLLTATFAQDRMQEDQRVFECRTEVNYRF